MFLFQTVFTEEQELELKEYILVMEQMMFGIGPAEVRRLAWQMDYSIRSKMRKLALIG